MIAPGGWHRRWRSRTNLGDYEGALTDFNRVLEIELPPRRRTCLAPAPTKQEWNTRGRFPIYLGSSNSNRRTQQGFLAGQAHTGGWGCNEEALTDYEAALVLADDQEVRFVLSEAIQRFRKVRAWPEADEDACTEFIGRSSNEEELVDAYRARASLYGKRGAFEEALEDITAGINLASKPEVLKALLVLRIPIFQWELGETVLALSDIEEAIQIATDPAEIAALENAARSIHDD